MARVLSHLLVLVLLGTSFIGCTRLADIRVVHVPGDSPAPASRIQWILDYNGAVATIASVMEEDLRLGPVTATLHFFPDRQAFQDALIGEGYDSGFARDTASSLDAIAGHRRVLLNEAALARLGWTDRVALLAHELTHTAQYELAGGRRGSSDQWLREGFAEWVSWRVLEALGASTMAAGRRTNLGRVRAAHARAELPALARLVTFRQWVGLRTHQGAVPMYAQSFLAVDFLIERHGLDRVLKYFRAFGQSDDRIAIFQQTFGETLVSFERAFRSHLGRRLR
jgi:hypothetical protein